MSDRQPADGAAIILHLIEVARKLTADHLSEIDPSDFRRLGKLCDDLEARYVKEQPAPDPVGWEPRRWRELVAGDTVEVSGHQAVIASAITQHWHADPKSSPYAPTPLEHSVTEVTLEGRDAVYRFRPDDEVETLRGPAGQALDEANHYRSVLHEEPIDVMASWAADAALTLEKVGLGPVEVIL